MKSGKKRRKLQYFQLLGLYVYKTESSSKLIYVYINTMNRRVNKLHSVHKRNTNITVQRVQCNDNL